ncbi:MAG: MBL fold metallo-hydrolase [Thermodesulfobacteriota bacterium]
METKGLKEPDIVVKVVGPLEENCYILYDGETSDAVVIDPGDEGKDILKEIKDRGLSLKYIINTHGHFDHIGANGFLKEATGAKIAIHREDASMLKDAVKQASFFGVNCVSSPEPDVILTNGDMVGFGDITLKVIHTPGHTKGGISLYRGTQLFVGDTLFAGSVGRTDRPGGSHTDLIKSIKEKLLPLGDMVKVFPGHGPQTTIGEERLHNPFLTP